MLSFRNQSISRSLFRRQVLAMLLGTASCLPAVGEEGESQQPPVFSTTTLKIRSATRTWSDDGKPVTYQPSLRFRPPASNPEPTRAGNQNPPEANASVVGAAGTDKLITNDNWVARDAVNLKQPLRDPLPPTAAALPREQLQLQQQAPKLMKEVAAPPSIQKPGAPPATQKPSVLAGPANDAPYETRRPTPPATKASTPSNSQERVPSATLSPPLAPSVGTPAESDHVGDLHNGLLRLVTPSEINELRSLDAPVGNLSVRVSDEPELKEHADDLPNLESARSPLTAVESILSADADGRNLHAPTETDTSIENEDESSEWEFEQLPDELETGDLETGDLLEGDLDNSLHPLEGPTHEASETESDSESTRGGIELRRLKIDRDGSPADASDRQRTFERAPMRESENSLRDTEGDNEPLQRYLKSSTPSLGVGDTFDAEDTLDAEEANRLKVLPIAQPRSVEPNVPLGQLDYTGQPMGPMQVTTAVRRLQPMMKSCLSYYHGTPEEATGRSNWGMMHQIMVYGVDTNIRAGRNSHNAIAWIAGNNACRGQRILASGPRGIEAKSGVGLQGHQGQLLAVLSICDVPDNYPLYVATEKFYVRDLVREEMAICKSGEELTFTLIGLSHYLDTDEQWRSADGQIWDFERLIREELSQPIVGAACGGTHRLMGFAHALRQRRAEGKEISGQWLRAEKFLDEFVQYTYQLQNRDGSMSTNWFEGREDNGDLDRKVQTTGHMVEWLLTYTPDQDLQNPRMVAAIQFLLNTVNSDRKHDWQIGPKGHALRSLAMYYERVYQSGSAWSRTPVTARSTSTTRR